MSLWLMVFIILPLTSLFAQQNATWSLPPNYAKFTPGGTQTLPLPHPAFQPDGVTPNDSTTMTDGYDGQVSEYAHNAMQDVNGNLLFFIVDGFVFDKLGQYIGKICSLYSVFGTTEIMIVPDPNDCDKYYLFADGIFDTHSYTTSMWYSVLDLTPDNLNPGPYYPTISSTMALTTNVKNYYNNIAATKINNGSRFVFLDNSGRLYRYKLDANGLNLENTYVYSNASMLWDQGTRTEMELIETLNNANQPVYKIAIAFHASGPKNVVYMAELDINTGDVVSGTEEFKSYFRSSTGQDALVHGLEFSPNGKTLYITHEKTTLYPSGIDYYILGSGTVPQSLNITTDADFQFSQIELGKDGKLYFATNNRLATLAQSNTPLTSVWNNASLSISYNENYAYITNSGGFYGTKTYLLPDQIDGMNYATHFTINTECCIANTTFTTGTEYDNYQQYGVQTWGATNPFNNASTITVKDELIIKAGANITANNLRFEFAPDAKLVIETGATFTINNCTLTANIQCDTTAMWNGVEVFGPSNGQQTTAGKFFANNSLIEHAYMATHNFSTVKSGTSGVFWDSGHRGGVILATNTTFRNNHRGTVFFDFQNSNGTTGIDDQSKFNNCTFVTDAPLKKPTLTPTVIMAHLFGVQGVNFLGCDFKNTAALATIPYIDRGLGIAADNCLLTVIAIASGTLNADRSTFTDLLRGIEAYSSLSSARTTKVVNTDFYNNWRSIYLKTNNLAVVTSNNINVGSGSAWGASYGLYLDACDKYKVENNNFNTTTLQNGYCGVYVKNSGIENNEIYRNTFDHLAVGSQAEGNNGNRNTTNGGLGLEFRCNNYTNTNAIDIYVSSGWIKPQHGQCVADITKPSNNKFSYTAPYGDFWQDSSVVDFVSYQYSIGANLAPRNGYFNTINTNPTVCADVYNPATSCPVRLKKGELMLITNLATQKTVSTSLMAQIDNNNTQELLAAIQTQSVGAVKNALITASPYLSDEVLLAYLQSNPPYGNLQQVLLANSPLSEQTLQALGEINLPKGVKNVIDNAQTGTSAMQELKGTIAYHQNEIENIKSDMLRYYLFEDGVGERLKKSIEFLELESTDCLEKRCQLTEFYTANKNYSEATQELTILSQNPANADYVKLFTNMIALEQSTNPTQELALNLSKQQPIIEVAEATNRKQETAMAEVMLKRSKLRNYQETIEELNIGGSGLRLMNKEDEKQSSIFNLQSAITVFPNPTSNEVNITHNLSLENGKVTFKVYNMLGVDVLNENLTSANNEVKINNLKSGVYFYTITQNNQTIKTDKLMVK